VNDEKLNRQFLKQSHSGKVVGDDLEDEEAIRFNPEMISIDNKRREP